MRFKSIALNSDTQDVRTLGVIFAAVGSLPLFMLFSSRGQISIVGRLMSVIDTLILVGPGVWYIVAASMMRRGSQQAVWTSRRVIFGQLALVVLVLAPGFLLGAKKGGEAGMLTVPALLAVFFVPALLALLRVLRRVENTLRIMDPGGRAFETLPVASLAPSVATTHLSTPQSSENRPPESAPVSVATDMPESIIQTTDSVRPK